ncbi:hypothetical protein DFH07DRAFT_779683 [Mycena maculata]|uniref:Uncharacterized protein n=1 Tax=Mycena maculata TaxID=230809 RepID=A0AAD7I6P3_9AGAR|nr:hypothetical protein DFH07DRAFT_779683 [Mycena maculata]
MLLEMPHGFGTQNNWDAMHDSIRYELGGQDSSHTGQAMEVSDDEDNQYEQPAQGPDDQESVRSETQRLSHNGDVNLTRVTGDSAGNNGKWRYRSESLERRSVGSEMSLADDDGRHSEEATRWQDEAWAASIRYRTAFPDSGLQSGASIASSNYNEDERGQYEQPAQEFDDQESVASETQTLSLDANVTQDEGDSVGTEFREFGKWRHRSESLERRSVGSEMNLIDDDARHSEHPNSDMSMDSAPDSASVGSEVVPQCFGVPALCNLKTSGGDCDNGGGFFGAVERGVTASLLILYSANFLDPVSLLTTQSLLSADLQRMETSRNDEQRWRHLCSKTKAERYGFFRVNKEPCAAACIGEDGEAPMLSAIGVAFGRRCGESYKTAEQGRSWAPAVTGAAFEGIERGHLA